MTTFLIVSTEQRKRKRNPCIQWDSCAVTITERQQILVKSFRQKVLDKVKVLKCLVTSTRADALMKTIMQKKEGEEKKKVNFMLKCSRMLP